MTTSAPDKPALPSSPHPPQKHGRKSRHQGERGGHPVVLKKGTHPITNELLDLEVRWVLDRLRFNGHLAYVVGGGVRDLLLGHQPKDFDLGTDATPDEIYRMFYNCRIIGRRFRIAHIYFRDGRALELSTFRSRPSDEQKGPLQEDNQFGTPAEDAWRRDLTINGLFYDSETGDVIDHVGGLLDLRKRIVRTIGPPRVRFAEDPVRMIRAIRHAVRHSLTIEDDTYEAIGVCADHIRLCSSARLLAEFQRELSSGRAAPALRTMMETGLLGGWMPLLEEWLHQEPTERTDIPPKRFGPYVNLAWGRPEAFWEHLSAIDMLICNGHELPEHVLMASFVVAMGWSHVFQAYEVGYSTRRLWKDAIDGPIRTFCKDLSLRAATIERMNRLFHTYWRLHLYPLQRGVRASLFESPFLDDALLLMKIELQIHQVHFPDWLDDFTR